MFNEDARHRFAIFADVLLPPTDEMPAASQTSLASTGLDTLATAAPRFAQRLATTLSATSPGAADAIETLEALQRDDPDAYDLIRVAAGAAYYLDARVRERIGYPGQEPTATIPGRDDAYLTEGLLDHVAERGPRYRGAE